MSIGGIKNQVVRGGKKKISKQVYMVDEYWHPKVTKLFKKKGILYVVEGKDQFSYDVNRVTTLQIREHKRQGVQ